MRKIRKNTKKVLAFLDHVLNYDDLIDISLVVFLLASPNQLYPIVLEMEPFLDGMKLNSEYEFAFTNLLAMIKHIENTDIIQLKKTIKTNIDKEAEFDPLKIMR